MNKADTESVEVTVVVINSATVFSREDAESPFAVAVGESETGRVMVTSTVVDGCTMVLLPVDILTVVLMRLGPADIT